MATESGRLPLRHARSGWQLTGHAAHAERAHNILGSLEGGGSSTSIGNAMDMSAIVMVRSMWRLIVHRTIMERISAKVVICKLLPIRMPTLCTLVLDTIKSCVALLSWV
jgi:hypothetical protein